MTEQSERSVHGELMALHGRLAERNCASTEVVRTMAQLGKTYAESVAAGLLTLGGLHAPLEEAAATWKHGTVPGYVESLNLVPGYGSSWVKDGNDAEFDRLRAFLPGDVLTRLDEITCRVQIATGSNIFPNAAMYTAIAGDLLGYEPEELQILLINGRLPRWTIIWGKHYRSL